MKRSTLFIVCFFATHLASSSSRAAGDMPTIVAAAVKEAPDQEIVRLVVAPAVNTLEHNVVCGSGTYWVRLPQVASIKDKAHAVSVDQASSFARVRLAPKDGSRGTVVQIVPRDHSLGTCERIAVISLGAEIAIAVPLTKENKRRKAKFAALSEQLEKNPIKAESGPEALEEPALEKKPGPQAAGDKAPPEASSSEQDDSKKLADVLSHTAEPQKEAPSNDKLPSEVATANGIDLGRAMLAFGFAALLAGLAYYLKQRKGKVVLDDPDTIEILSSKRLGAKQQLVLASVQGTRFLLAIADKTVTTLGMLPEKGSAAPSKQSSLPSFQTGPAPGSLQVIRQNLSPQPAPAEAATTGSSNTNVHDLLKEMLKQKTMEQEPAAGPRTPAFTQTTQFAPAAATPKAKQPPTQTPRPAPINPSEPAVDFQHELQNALQSAGHSGEIDRNTSETTSNVAGLIAMARARAGLRPRPADASEPQA